MHRMPFYSVDGLLSASELSAARLDGVLFEVGDGYMPADTVEGNTSRAVSIGMLLIPGVALCGPSAAWVHGAGDGPPARHHVQRMTHRRIRATLPPRVQFHEPTLDAGDLTTIAGVALTRPARTLMDLARGVHRHPDYSRWTRHLVEYSPELAIVARHDLESLGRAPGKREGITLLTTIYEEVTR